MKSLIKKFIIGYYGFGVDAGLGTAAFIGAESRPYQIPHSVATYPDNSPQQTYQNQ